MGCGGWVDLEPTTSSGGASGMASSGAAGTGSGNSGGRDANGAPFKILILSTSLGEFRHDSIANCQRMLADLGQTPDDKMPEGTKPGSQFTTVIATDDLADFTESGLKDYGAVFWCSPIGTVFSNSPLVPKGVPAIAMSALQGYVEGGGAWCGVHSATDFEKTGAFPWYTNTLVGGYLDTFLQDGTSGTVQVEADYTDHPVMRGVPPTWSVKDEWFRMNRDIGAQPGFQILSRLATSTDNRPVVWIKDFGTNSGRMFYTTRGHAPAVYGEPEFQRLVLNGILWATHRLE
jgi:type 1 glutamine amidotransferase